MNKTLNLDAWFQNEFLSLHQRRQKHTLHHGLLLSGLGGIGKRKFAKNLAHSLLCQTPNDGGPCGSCQGCSLYTAGSHPDLQIVESEKQIGVDAIRQVSSKLQTTAQIGQHKVCIIVGAESMTEAASNALLKTLEEPTPDTYLILVSDAPHKLLPTILSRCEKHGLTGPTPEQTQFWLSQNYLNTAPATERDIGLSSSLVKLYQGSPYALAERLNDDKLPDIDAFYDELQQASKGQVSSLSLAKKWENHGDLLLTLCSDIAYQQYKKTLSAIDYQPYKACIQAQSKLMQVGINKLLVLQSVVEKIAGSIGEKFSREKSIPQER